MPGNRYHPCRPRELSIPQAFAVALLIESLFTVTALRLVPQRELHIPAPTPVPFTVTLARLQPAAPHIPKPAPEPPRQHPKVHHRVHHPKPITHHHSNPPPAVKHLKAPKPVPKAVQKPAPAPPAPPAPAVHAARPSPQTLARMTVTFKDAVRSAVKSAVHYPRAAQVMSIEGATEVGFEYQDGAARHVRVVRSSGSPILDQAALNAVRHASLPAAPAALNGQILKFRIWLRFHFNG
jgi:protein TonB